MRSGRAVAQPCHAFRVEPMDPFGHDLGRYVELARGRSLAQAGFGYTAHHRLSTFGRQRRILVAVHLVSPWNTEASQPQLPRFRPDGQPPERPHLERDDFSSNRHPALSFCLSMISAQTLRVCPVGKPVPTFPDHALDGDARRRAPRQAAKPVTVTESHSVTR